MGTHRGHYRERRTHEVQWKETQIRTMEGEVDTQGFNKGRRDHREGELTWGHKG